MEILPVAVSGVCRRWQHLACIELPVSFKNRKQGVFVYLKEKSKTGKHNLVADEKM